MVGAQSPPEELLPAVLWPRSRRHTFSLSTYPPATQGRTTLGTAAPSVPQGSEGLGAGPATAAWGPGRRESKAGHVGPCFHLSASKRCKQTLSPCQALQQLAAYSPSLSFPILFSFPERRQGPNPDTQRAGTAGRAGNAGQGLLCSKRQVCWVGMGGGGGHGD